MGKTLVYTISVLRAAIKINPYSVGGNNQALRPPRSAPRRAAEGTPPGPLLCVLDPDYFHFPSLTGLILIAALSLLENVALGAPAAGSNNHVVLYQVGKDGSYCVSITPNTSGCISGANDNGDTTNVLNFLKGRTVVFRNMSDAPHDMRITGANAQDFPAQLPNAGDVQKPMSVEDVSKQKITCSFHGNQLAVGYRVTPSTENIAQGHKDGTDGMGSGGGDAGAAVAGGAGGAAGVGKVTNTGLADVSKEVIAKGRPAEVAKLVEARPDLMGQLQQMRPLLAQEISSGKGGLDKSFGYDGKNGGAAVATGAGSAGVAGAGVQKGAVAAGAKAGAGGDFSDTGVAAAVAAGTGTVASSLGEMASDVATAQAKAQQRLLASNTGTVITTESGSTGADGKKKVLAQREMDPRIAKVGPKFPDRTRMRLANKKKTMRLEAFFANGHRWLILILLIITAYVARKVILASRKRGKAHHA